MAGRGPGVTALWPGTTTALCAEVERLTHANQAQAAVIAALVDSAERQHHQVGQRLGTQHLVEQRTARLHHAERLLRSVVESLDGALCIVGQDGTVLDANRRWPAPVGSGFFDWCATTPDLHHLLTDVATAVRDQLDPDPDRRPDQVVTVKGRIGPEGRRRWVLLRVHPVRDHLQARAVVIMVDVTDGMRTQEELHEATHDAEQLAAALTQEKTLLTGVLATIPQLVYWKDDQGRYAGCNRAYLDLLGLDCHTQLMGRRRPAGPTHELLQTTLDTLEAKVVGGGSPVLDHTVELPDRGGRVRSLLLSVLPLDLNPPGGPPARGVIAVGADVTHPREMERQLAQANRLESIGQLAAGIAHEINTPVQFVTDNTQFVSESVTEMLTALLGLKAALEDHDGDGDDGFRDRARGVLDGLDLDLLREEIPGALKDSREGLGRVAQIVRAMKDYAHPGTRRADVDINRAIESTVHVCRNEWKYVAEVELDLDPHAGLVPAYEGELKQVVLNMVVNAAQAIADDPRREPGHRLGRIRLTTQRTQTELRISICDDGPGMPAHVRERVFDPFFTTKQVGKGTGQGLSLAHAVIVTKHRGRIDLDTSPGQGATFTLRLPLDQQSEPQNDPAKATTSVASRRNAQ